MSTAEGPGGQPQSQPPVPPQPPAPTHQAPTQPAFGPLSSPPSQGQPGAQQPAQGQFGPPAVPGQSPAGAPSVPQESVPYGGWGPSASGQVVPPAGAPAGWPGQPPQSPQAPRKKRKGLGCLISFLVVLALLLIPVGAGAWLWAGIGKGDVLWTVDFASTRGDTQNYRATWFTDKYVVRAEMKSVLGLDEQTGKQAWSVLVPDHDAIICSASSVSSQGVAVLAYGKMGYCSHAFAVDMKAGKLLWDKALHKNTREQPSIAVAGGTVVLEDGMAYGLHDGKARWKSGQLAGGHDCSSGAFTGGDTLVRTQSCAVTEDSSRFVISKVDPQTGHVKWTYEAEKGHADGSTAETDGQVLSTSPVVALVAEDAYRVLTETGEPQALLEMDAGPFLRRRSLFKPGSPSATVTASGDTLVVKHPNSSQGGADDVVEAFSVSTGKQLWSKDSQSGDVWYTLAEADGDRLVAMKYDSDVFTFPPDKKVSSLVEFDPVTGAETEIQNYQAIGETLGFKYYATPYLHDGKLFMASAGADTSVGELVDEGGPIGAEFHPLSLVVLET